MRAKVFVSYSHTDRLWMDLVRVHIAVLERLGLVDVWDDNRIAVGANWEQEIETALKAARVTVLIISPGFLASDYVWQKEMPRILAHQEDGMKILPVVARPCAWRLEECLSRLQARPLEGRALSTGSDAQIDQDLAALTYELADMLGKMPEGARAYEEREPRVVVPLTSSSPGDEPRAELSSRQVRIAGAPPIVWLSQRWQGEYPGTNRHLQIEFTEPHGRSLEGQIIYDFGDAKTNLVGTIVDRSAAMDSVWLDLGVERGDLALTFREQKILHQGSRDVDLRGEYRAVTTFSELKGAWVQDGRVVSRFTLLAMGPYLGLGPM